MRHMDLTRSFLIVLQVSVCPLWASSPPVVTIRALRGSCVVIPCTFTNPEPRTRINFITWNENKGEHGQLIYKSITYSSSVIEGYRGRTDFVGDLDNNNCSLQINNVKSKDAAEYFPWIDPLTENKMLHKLQVSDSPEELSLSDPGVMTDGRSVLITCSAVHTCPPSPPTLTWDGHSGSASIRHEDLGDGRWRVVSELTYSPVSENHGKSLLCMATYPGNIVANKSITFNIKYSPKNTTLVAKEIKTLTEGDTVTLICSASGNPETFNYSWYEGPQRALLQNQRQELTLSNITWDSGPYYCRAQNDVGTEDSAPLHMHIKYAPKGTRVHGPENDPLQGEMVMLTCQTNGSNPPVTYYTWYRNGDQIEGQGGNTLKVNKLTFDESTDYHCVAHNEVGGSPSAPLNLKADGSSGSEYISAAGAAAGVLLIVMVLLLFVFMRRKKKQEAAVSRKSVIRASTAQQDPPDLVYCQIDHSQQFRRQRRTVPSDESVTYAAVARSVNQSKPPVEPPTINSDDMYAQVKKSARPPKKDGELVYATGLQFKHPRRNQQEAPINDLVEYAAVKR